MVKAVKITPAVCAAVILAGCSTTPPKTYSDAAPAKVTTATLSAKSLTSSGIQPPAALSLQWSNPPLPVCLELGGNKTATFQYQTNAAAFFHTYISASTNLTVWTRLARAPYVTGWNSLTVSNNQPACFYRVGNGF